MARIDIVGLTLAEITLGLLFSFLALFAPAYASLYHRVQAANPTELERLKTENAQLTERNSRLQDQVASLISMRSKALPSCIEASKADGYVATLTIRGRDAYDAGDGVYTLELLTQKYSLEIANAKQAGCVQAVLVYYGSGVSVDDYDLALRRIEQVFYDAKRGVEPSR